MLCCAKFSANFFRDLFSDIVAALQLIVTARDQGPEAAEAEATVIVQVEDVNDNAPMATISTLTATNTTEAFVPENADAGTFVAQVVVDDPDKGQGI